MVLLPHGGFPLFIVAVSMMAWISFLSQDGCDYVRLSGPSVTQFTNGPYPFVEIGFRGYRVPIEGADNEWKIMYNRCISYDSSSFDGFWGFGRICHAAAAVFGGAGALFFCFISIGLVMTQQHWRLAATPFIFATLLQLLSFIWFENELCKGDGNTCVLFYGSMSAIVSLVLYCISAVAILYYPEPKVAKFLKKNYGHELYNLDTRHSVMTDPRLMERTDTAAIGRSKERAQSSLTMLSQGNSSSANKDRNKQGTIYI